METNRPTHGDVLVMVGTRKGAFLFWADPRRENWKQTYHHEGWMVHHMAFDQRDGAIYAAANSAFYGGLVQRTRDLGRSWEPHGEDLNFPAETERRVEKVWHVRPAPADQPGRVYVGVERAGLFVSDDEGAHWRGAEGLNDHEHSGHWQPGAGGLILHTILIDPRDPNRVYTAISAAGVYRSDDGGRTWAPKNKGVRADFLPDPFPEFGQCVHKLAMHADKPDVLYQQNHCGVYRSDDRGETWVDISEGLPSRFGFPFAIDTHDPDMVFIVPLTGQESRVIPDGKMTVWRSRDRGASWEPRSSGLPENAYLTILREGMAVDGCEPSGVYVGTKTGQLFLSRDGGDNWELMADFLPPIYSVSTAMVS